MSCARCGCGVYKTDEFISLNKVWHKYCFTCFQCNTRLDKDSAKIFQGELFCKCCYTSVIEKLFEVISCPSVNRPCKVSSTPSCAVNNYFESRLRNCENLLRNFNCCNKEYCFPAEKKLNTCKQRSVQSCSCIPTRDQSKNEYCFLFPIPREVANYYNRAHMKNKSCKDPISCCPTTPQCTSCRTPSCRPKCPIQLRSIPNQCCCKSPPPCLKPLPCPPCRSPPPTCRPSPCRAPSPQGCCCSAPKPPCHPKGCSCCLPSKSVCCEPCPPPKKCCSPCGGCSCGTSKPCKPVKYCLPPLRSPPTCPSMKCCPQKVDRCCRPTCEASSSENSNKFCCKVQPKCIKYCVCGKLNPCNCKMSQIQAQCTVCCNRCGQKVYAAEKILVSCGAYHTSCFTCFCCNKCLDVKNVCEGCGEIYCKHCYNYFFGIQYYGFGAPSNC